MPLRGEVGLVAHRAEETQRQLLVDDVVLGEQDPQRMPAGLLGVEVERASTRRLRSAGRRRRGRAVIVTWNVLPIARRPSLSAHIVPPINSARRLEMASPRPVPP